VQYGVFTYDFAVSRFSGKYTPVQISIQISRMTSFYEFLLTKTILGGQQRHLCHIPLPWICVTPVLLPNAARSDWNTKKGNSLLTDRQTKMLHCCCFNSLDLEVTKLLKLMVSRGEQKLLFIWKMIVEDSLWKQKWKVWIHNMKLAIFSRIRCLKSTWCTLLYIRAPFLYIHFSLFIEIIRKYSNFVGFPIFLNGVCINTVEVSTVV
jgi:hypothetical protein